MRLCSSELYCDEVLLISCIRRIGSERFNECLELIKEQNLYTEALQLYTGPEYKTIAGCYGEYLIEKKRYEESSIGKIPMLFNTRHARVCMY